MLYKTIGVGFVSEMLNFVHLNLECLYVGVPGCRAMIAYRGLGPAVPS